MNGKEVFSITEFANYSRTTRATLLHYDKIGLLSPVARGENNYRFYSAPQLGAVNLIRTCQELGMPLNEVLAYKNNRSPENAMNIMDAQIGKIRAEIEEWQRALKLLTALRDIIDGVKGVDETAITVARAPAERIVLGPVNDYSRGGNANQALLAFYRACRKAYPDLDINYPVWGLFSERRVKKGDWVWPDRFYFCHPDGMDEKPEALYAVGYTRGAYGESEGLYRRLTAYIAEHGLAICGPAYEEYPLNEIAIADTSNYLMRISITVREA